jgi:diaminopimelate decarboxylase/aspartate kinase
LTTPATPWWLGKRGDLLAIAADRRPRFVYDLATVADRARGLRSALPSVDRFFYAMKANAHPRILETLAAEGFGMECVSPGEVDRARAVPGETVSVLFTPNFCAFEEYDFAFGRGALITVDGPQALEARPETFRGRDILLRVDPGRGFGHSDKVRTAGGRAKFGQAIDEMDRVAAAADRDGARVIGLHAHVGSGILDEDVWGRTGETLAGLRSLFRHLSLLNLGGGLGVAAGPGQEPLDLAAIERGLSSIDARARGLALWLEPGRYLVSEAGVLLAPVTQVRHKAGVRFVGIGTGMNSLIRPSLYGAWHGIHNLTRIAEAPIGPAHVVGPICESSDVLGADRPLPECVPGDTVLIENCGAYGAAMSSRYNLREPAEEVCLDGPRASRAAAK